jgi:hypothetical protein
MNMKRWKEPKPAADMDRQIGKLASLALPIRFFAIENIHINNFS